MKITRILFLVGLVIGSTGALHAQRGRDVWKEFLKDCATNDLVGKNLYMGPSNLSGLGYVFAKKPGGLFGKDDWSLKYKFKSYVPSEDQRQAWVERGNDVECSANVTKKLGLDISAALSALASPVTGSGSLSLNRYKTMEARVTSYAWDLLETGPWNEFVTAPEFSKSIHSEFEKPNRYVLTKVLRINGLTAELTYDSGLLAGADVDAKLQDLQGKLGAKFKLEKKTNTSLKISSNGEFYLIAEPSILEYGGLASSGSPLRAVEVPAEKKGSILVPQDN